MNHTSWVDKYIVYNITAKTVPELVYILQRLKQKGFQLVPGIDFSGIFTKAGRACTE